MMTNPVKRMEKMTKDIPQALVSGGFELVPVTKNAWKCLVCGRVWFAEHDAMYCNHEDYYEKAYGYVQTADYRNVPAEVTKFYCERKEEPETPETLAKLQEKINRKEEARRVKSEEKSKAYEERRKLNEERAKNPEVRKMFDFVLGHVGMLTDWEKEFMRSAENYMTEKMEALLRKIAESIEKALDNQAEQAKTPENQELRNKIDYLVGDGEQYVYNWVVKQIFKDMYDKDVRSFSPKQTEMINKWYDRAMKKSKEEK